MKTIEISEVTQEIIELKKQLDDVCNKVTDFLHDMDPSEDDCERALNKFGEIDTMLNDKLINHVSEELAGSGFKRI